MDEHTFAGHAAAGLYFQIVCRGCGAERWRTARSFVEAGFGAVKVVGCQERLCCPSCGHRGASIWLHGGWRGPWPPPTDWAETAEQRMRPPGSENGSLPT